jgi:hypothetical protein
VIFRDVVKGYVARDVALDGLDVCGAASLTWWRAPTLWLWKVAILVGEFGHFLLIVPVLIGIIAWKQGGELRGVIAVVCVVAVAALLRPVVQAAWIGRTLPAKLEAAFGKVVLNLPAFAWGRLLARAGVKVSVETSEVAPGLPMDFYRAVGRAALAPCVVMIHGVAGITAIARNFPRLIITLPAVVMPWRR